MHRVYWCTCGQKMRVPAERLGKTGTCAGCGMRINPTRQNTMRPEEGPPTPPPHPRKPKKHKPPESQSEPRQPAAPASKPPAQPKPEPSAQMPAEENPREDLRQQYDELEHEREALYRQLGILASTKRDLLEKDTEAQGLLIALDVCIEQIEAIKSTLRKEIEI